MRDIFRQLPTNAWSRFAVFCQCRDRGLVRSANAGRGWCLTQMMADFDFRKPHGMTGEWPVTMTVIWLASQSNEVILHAKNKWMSRSTERAFLKPERNGAGRTLPFTDDGEVERVLGTLVECSAG